MPTINSHIIILFVALNRCTIFTVVFISPLDGVIRKPLTDPSDCLPALAQTL